MTSIKNFSNVEKGNLADTKTFSQSEDISKMTN